MTLLEALGKLDATDFRVKGRTRHKASEIAATTVCSPMSGGTSYYDFAEFGAERNFISSLDVDPERALQAARSHWDVENPLHWVPDMIFDEDHSRARSGFSAENLAMMRHMAYNATRKSEATKGGMKRRKKSLTWNPDKLLATLRAA